jgi:hypothetical protein
VLGGHRYWDGAAWTGEATTAYGPGRGERPPLGAGFPLVAAATQVLLALWVLVSAVGGVVSWHEVHDLRRLDASDVTASSSVGDALEVLRLVLVALTAAAFITWLHRAHRSDRMHPESLSHASWWAVAGWFVPPMALWRPVAVVDEVRCGALNVERPRHGGLLGLWWAAYLLTLVTAVASWTPVPDGTRSAREHLDELVLSAQIGVVAGVAGTVAALTGLLVVRYLTARVMASESGPPPDTT